jgi:hypothetical protein
MSNDSSDFNNRIIEYQVLDKNDGKWQSEYDGTIILIVFERSSKFRNGDMA